MIRWLGRFSIRTLPRLVIVIMACMSLGDAVGTRVGRAGAGVGVEREPSP